MGEAPQSEEANQPKWKEIDPKVGVQDQGNQKVKKGKSHILQTYKANTPMAYIQWRHHQRKKKAERESFANWNQSPKAKRPSTVSKAQKEALHKRIIREG